jgi:hypothetical protein
MKAETRSAMGRSPRDRTAATAHQMSNFILETRPVANAAYRPTIRPPETAGGAVTGRARRRTCVSATLSTRNPTWNI